MGVMAETREMLAAKFEVLFPHLDERQRRLLMGAEARVLGHGGIRAVARAAGVREATVSAGVDELDTGAAPLGRARRPGGGRKRLSDVDPGLRPALLALVEPDERGDPTSPLRWTTKSTRTLAAELTAQGHRVGADTVADLLRQEGFSLQANTKTIEGKQHPDRDAQFRYLNEQIKDHQDSADPVISVDTKKKELVGQFTNAGQQWRPKGEPVRTRTHDFPDDSLGKAVPYGIYDLTADAGWVNVGTDHDTAAFAVESIRRWWNATGRSDYPNARRLLLTADAGGSNGYRTRAWKAELAALAVQTGLEITVCHFPPGTSKWNKSVWPLAATPGAMKCGGVRAARRVPVGRGRRLDLGVCEPETSLARGPEGPGSVAASTNPRFFSDLVPPRRVDLDPRRSGGTDP
jgi:transposase